MVAKSPDDSSRLYDLAFIDNKVGETLQEQGNLTDAITQFNTALAIARKIAAMPSAIIEWQAYLPSTLTKLANAFAANGDPDTALTDYSEAISLQGDLLKKYADNDIVSANLVLSHRLKADLLAKQGKFDLAFTDYGDALDIAKQLVDKDSGNAIWLTYLAFTHDHYGNALNASGNVSGALAQYQSEVVVWQRLANKDKTNSTWQKGLQKAQKKNADLQAARDQGAPVQPLRNQSNPNSVREAKP